jgi:PAS domain-containing protein
MAIMLMAAITAVFASLNRSLAAAQRAARLEFAERNAVVNASADGIVLVDQQRRITLFNPAAERIYGRTADETVGQPVACLMADEVRDGEFQFIGELFALFLEMARDIALVHHEKYYGRGYPRGLAGEEIPLAARVMALADVYDALTSRRVYKEAYSHERSKSMIVAAAGRHFDPAMVEAFLAHEERFITVRAQYAETGNKEFSRDLPEIAAACDGQ